MKKSTKLLSVSLALLLLVPLAALAAGPATVNLGSASNFVALAKSGISTTGSTAITGNIGVSPITATAITGFGLIMDSTNVFSTSALVTGKVYAADYAPPTPSTMTTAISDMETAYVDAAGRTTPTATGLGAGNIGGMTLAPGLYTWGTGVTIPTDVTLSGGANDVWIFQIAQTLTVSSGAHIILAGGAQASNIFWQVAGQTTIGTTAVFNGNILDQTAIVINTGAVLNGRALAQTAVTLDADIVSAPIIFVPVIPIINVIPVLPPPVIVVPPPVLQSTPITQVQTQVVTSTATTPLNTVTGNIAQTTATTPVTTAPGLPNTGFPPEPKNTPWYTVILSFLRDWHLF